VIKIIKIIKILGITAAVNHRILVLMLQYNGDWARNIIISAQAIPVTRKYFSQNFGLRES
jgi:hypothetical protein